MLKIKEEYNTDILLRYGFKYNHFDPCYELRTDDYILAVYCRDRDPFIKRTIYIEIYTACVLTDITPIIKLLEDGIIEETELY